MMQKKVESPLSSRPLLSSEGTWCSMAWQITKKNPPGRDWGGPMKNSKILAHWCILVKWQGEMSALNKNEVGYLAVYSYVQEIQ